MISDLFNSLEGTNNINDDSKVLEAHRVKKENYEFGCIIKLNDNDTYDIYMYVQNNWNIKSGLLEVNTDNKDTAIEHFEYLKKMIDNEEEVSILKTAQKKS